MDYSYEDLSRMIDHSLLKPTMPDRVFEEGIQTAIKYKTGSVCIQPYYLKRCAEMLAGTGVAASTVIAFPHGGHCTEIKKAEAEKALADGGQELDLVVNISKVLSGDWDYVKSDLKEVIDVTHAAGQKVKVIFENCYLNREQKIRLCRICSDLKADWVKTSTGYGTGGATMDDLQLMLENVDDGVQVKAAGGIRDLDKQIDVWKMGVTRIGCTRTAEMMEACRVRLGLPPIDPDFVKQSDAPSTY